MQVHLIIMVFADIYVLYKFKFCDSCVVKKMVNLFINKILLSRAYALGFRHDVIVHLLDYSINITFYALKPNSLDSLYCEDLE